MKRHFALLVLFIIFICFLPAFASAQVPDIAKLTLFIDFRDPKHKSYCITINTNTGLEVTEPVNNSCGKKNIDYFISAKDQNFEARSKKEKILAGKIISDPVFVGKVTMQVVSVIGQVLSGNFKPRKAK